MATGVDLATSIFDFLNSTTELADTVYAKWTERKKAEVTGRERLEREERDWVELSLLAMMMRADLDSALRSPTLTPEGRDHLLRANGDRLEELAEGLGRAPGGEVVGRLTRATGQIESAGTAIQAWRRADAALEKPIWGARSLEEWFDRRCTEVEDANRAYGMAWKGLVDAARSTDDLLLSVDRYGYQLGVPSMRETAELMGRWDARRLAEPLTWSPFDRTWAHRRASPPPLIARVPDAALFEYTVEPSPVRLAWRAAIACKSPERGMYAGTKELADQIDSLWPESLPGRPALSDELKLLVLERGFPEYRDELAEMRTALGERVPGHDRSQERMEEIHARARFAWTETIVRGPNENRAPGWRRR